MLSLIRNIRRSVMNSRSTRKYLLYALGEIFLVMIGILLALQVNNWNQKRISNSNQRDLLRKLTRDLEADIKRNQEIDSVYEDWLVQIDYVYDNVLTGKLERLTHLNQMVPGRGSMLYLDVRKSSYDEMINSGILYTLSDELSDLINNYYELASFEIEKVNRDNQDFADYELAPGTASQKNIVIRLITQRNLNYIDWSWMDDPHSNLYQHVETYCGWLAEAINANIEAMDKINSEAQNLIAIINMHLSK